MAVEPARWAIMTDQRATSTAFGASLCKAPSSKSRSSTMVYCMSPVILCVPLTVSINRRTVVRSHRLID